MRQIEKHIEDAGYRLALPLDREVRTGTFITVAPSLADRTPSADETYSFIAGEEADIYHCAGRQVHLYPGGRTVIHYIPGIPLELSEPKEETLKGRVEAFLQDNFNFFQVKFDRLQEEIPGERIITYIQDAGGAGLYSSFIRVTVTGERLTAIEYLWLKLLKQSGEHPLEMISSAEAVLKLVEELGPADRERWITRIDLGFYSEEYEAEQWDIPPVWRVIIDHRQIYYINAFTGHLEHGLNIDGEERSSKI